MAQELSGSPSPQPFAVNARGSDRGNHGLTVAIIGGGYAGMAAAAELASRGIQVTIFESARQLGGRARGVQYNGIQLDNGQHLLLGCYRETLRLIELVGGNIERDFLRLPLQLDLHGHFSLKAPRLPAPLHLLAALLGADGLSLNDRLKAARFMRALRRMRFRLPRDMTVAALLSLHGQDADLTLKLWEPLTLAALNTPLDKASAQVLLNVLRDALSRTRADSDMLLPRLDLTALFPQRAAAYVEQRGGRVHLSCGVEAIVPRGAEIELVSPKGTQRFGHVICATPAGIAAKLLGSLQPAQAQQIQSLAHQPIYTVYLQYPEHIRLPHPMVGLHCRRSQWLFDKGQVSGQHGLIASVISAEGSHQALHHEALAREIIAELKEEFGIAEPLHWVKIIAEKRATFSCTPDLDRPSQQTGRKGLLRAGDYTAGEYPATIEGAVQSGLRCAELVLGNQ